MSSLIYTVFPKLAPDLSVCLSLEYHFFHICSVKAGIEFVVMLSQINRYSFLREYQTCHCLLVPIGRRFDYRSCNVSPRHGAYALNWLHLYTTMACDLVKPAIICLCPKCAPKSTQVSLSTERLVLHCASLHILICWLKILFFR